MVPHVRGRPLALHSFPQGVEAAGYFVKDAPSTSPSWIATVAVPKREGGTIHHVLADDAATLVYLAGQNVITPHVWTSRADRLERPDRLVFDLDPPTRRFDEVRAAARGLGDLLRDLGLVPVRDDHRLARAARRHALRRTPTTSRCTPLRGRSPTRWWRATGALTIEFRREKRGERIFVDIGRNAYGQHAVAPYAVRALPQRAGGHAAALGGAGRPTLDPQGWTVATLGDRLADGGDPWRDIARHARALGPARRALAALG